MDTNTSEKISWIETAIKDDAETGRKYSPDFLNWVQEEALSSLEKAIKPTNPALWDLVDDTVMLVLTIQKKEAGTMTDREAQNLLTMIPEISGLIDAVKAK
jgi:predicted Ser/Thr protein kinase